MTTAAVRVSCIDTKAGNNNVMIRTVSGNDEHQNGHSKQFFIKTISDSNDSPSTDVRRSSINSKGSHDSNGSRNSSARRVPPSSFGNDEHSPLRKSLNGSNSNIDAKYISEKSPVSLGGSITLIQRRRLNRTTSFRHSPALKRVPCDEHQKPLPYITTLIQDFQWALNDLGWECMDVLTNSGNSTIRRSVSSGSKHKRQLFDERKLLIEKWAYFVDGSLNGAGRNFHGLTKIFEITESASSLQLLAAAFRDIVSYSVCSSANSEERSLGSGGVDELLLQPKHLELIGDIIEFTQIRDENSNKPCVVPRGTWKEIRLTSMIENNRTDMVVCSIFGLKPGDDLWRLAGLNRGLDVFLSACIAARTLKNVLSLAQIAQLVTVMAATIPKMKRNKKVGSSRFDFDNIHSRLIETNHFYKLAMNEDTMIEAVQLGADLKNRLFGYMATKEVASFLENTWKMLPERCPSMRDVAAYNILDYCAALQSMLGHMKKVQNETFFEAFRNIPSKDEVTVWQYQSTKNFQIVNQYLQARLVAVIVVACIAHLTGGTSAPAAYFLGDIPSIRNTNPKKIGDGIKEAVAVELENDDDVKSTVYNLLLGNDEQLMKNGFDTRRAPFAAYLFQSLNKNNLQAIIQSWTMPLDDVKANQILETVPFSTFETIAAEFSSFVVSRSRSVNRLVQRIGNERTQSELMYFV